MPEAVASQAAAFLGLVGALRHIILTSVLLFVREDTFKLGQGIGRLR
jgi:hypothetical protein